MSRYVGIDLHRRRSVVVILDEEGRQLSWTRIDNSPLALVEAVLEAAFNSLEGQEHSPTQPDRDDPVQITQSGAITRQTAHAL